jgi:RNA polymerase sigma-70 factor (ECF subfamily)
MDTNRTEQGAVFATQLGEHLGYLRRFARSRMRDEDLAEEAVQETLLAALESGERFGGRAKLRTWLTGILLHKIHDEFRRGAREGAHRLGRDDGADGQPPPEESIASPEGGPDHAFHCRQLRAAIDRAVAALPPRQKEAFLLKEISGLDTAQLQGLLGVSPGNVWVLLHRARAHLQDALAREGFSAA